MQISTVIIGQATEKDDLADEDHLSPINQKIQRFLKYWSSKNGRSPAWCVWLVIKRAVSTVNEIRGNDAGEKVLPDHLQNIHKPVQDGAKKTWRVAIPWVKMVLNISQGSVATRHNVFAYALRELWNRKLTFFDQQWRFFCHSVPQEAITILLASGKACFTPESYCNCLTRVTLWCFFIRYKTAEIS